MEYRKLGKTEIKVSCLCLGTMTWGEQNSQEEAHRQLDYAVERGINFIDTAEMYPVPAVPETQGRTEECIGTWPALARKRDKIILATKVAGPGFHLRGGRSRFTKEIVREALHDSLKRLKTDYVDLYQLHWPERTTNRFGRRGFAWIDNEHFTPLEEVLQTLEELRREGKIRHAGISNESPWGTMKYLKISEHADLLRMVSIQNPYNLLNRTFETGMAEIAMRENCRLLAYSPLAFGVLSGKYLENPNPPGARLTLFPNYARYTGPKAVAATRDYVRLAKEHGISPVAMSLQFVTSRPFVTSNIIGATTMEQLTENIDSTEVPPPRGTLPKNRIHPRRQLQPGTVSSQREGYGQILI